MWNEYKEKNMKLKSADLKGKLDLEDEMMKSRLKKIKPPMER